MLPSDMSSPIFCNCVIIPKRAPAPDIDGVIDINPDEKNSIEYYSLDGRMIATPQKGLNLVKTADGKVIKVFVK